MAHQEPGYFQMPGKGKRYSDGKGGIFHNHLGPSLTQFGNLFKAPGRAVQGYVDANPLTVDESGKSKVAGGANPVRPSQPTGEDTVYAPRIERKPGPFDPGYVKPNTTMEPTDPAARNEYLNPAPDVAFVPDSTLNNGRDNSRKNANGIVQKGTDMSRSFNDLLATTNTSGYQPFSSNQLPTTAGSPDSGVTPKTQAILAGIQAGKQTDMSIDGYEGPSYTAVQPDSPQFAEAFGQDLADKYKGAADSKVTGYTKGGRLDQALSDTAGMQSYMSKFSSGDRERAANRAFLDTEDSMLALRAKEAVNNVVYANQKHYIPGASGDDPAVAITRDQARGISNGRTDAQTLLKAHIDKNKTETPDTPAESQDPLTPAGSAVRSGFAAGAKTDFNLNNSQDTPQVGTGPTVPANIVENYDFSKPGAEEKYFGPGGILEQHTKRK
jgi:hypothetical protein